MTQTITALIVALQGIDPAALITLTLPGAVTMIVAASDLDAALGVHIAKVLYSAQTATAVNLRDKPTTTGKILRTMAVNTAVDVYTPISAAVAADTYFWLYVRTSDGAFGWCAAEYLIDSAGKALNLTLNPPLSGGEGLPGTSQGGAVTAVSGHRFGLHFLQNADQAIAWVGKHLIPSATVINRPDFANTLVADGVRYVLYRSVGGADGDAFPVPSDSAGSAAYGHALFESQWQNFEGLDPRVYIQLLNESPFGAGHNAFWMAAMAAAEAHGRRLAIGGYAVGGPEPADWLTLIPALQHAQAHGHVVCLHEYTAQITPYGQLSATNLEQYYELRFERFYNAVPEDARPPLVIGEFGNFNAVDTGSPDVLNLCKLFEAVIAPYDYVKGYNYWTAGDAGGWGKSDMTAALPTLEQWLAGP